MENRRSLLTVWLIVALLLPVTYVLSIGPAAWLVSHGYVGGRSADALHAFYWPLGWLCQQWTPAEEALVWYESQWFWAADIDVH